MYQCLLMLYFLFIVLCTQRHVFNIHVKCFLGSRLLSSQWRAHWWYRTKLSFPLKQKTAYYSVSFLSRWRTGRFLFFLRNGLSDSGTTCSVPQEIKEDGDRARLDSMVLLIMKLDQLDQDIENALSTGSSPSSTPTSLRRRVPVSLPPPTSFPTSL